MRKIRTYLPLVFLLSCAALSAQIRTPHVPERNSLIRFTENKHQWDDFIKYRAQLDGGALYVQNNTLTYGFYDKETYRSMHATPKLKPAKEIKTTGFDVKFENSNPNARIESSNPTPDYCNYFLGKDPAKWAGNVKNYQRLLYNDLWKDINMEILGQDNSVKYNFYVKAGANPNEIKLHYNKIEKISLHKKELILKTPLNEMVEHEPYAYQSINGEKLEVPCKYELKNNIVSFSFPKGYNKNYELVIDPVLVFSCQSGSLADNFGMTATYDSLGNLYSGGTCFGSGFPIVNAYDSTYNGVVQYGMTDVVITKYDSSGMFLHYSTYIGGASSSEIVTSLIVDHQNNLYLYGATGSSDFPMTSFAYDKTYNGGDTMLFMFNGTYFYTGTDIYIAKLNAGGNNLLASTFIGGSRNDGVNTNNHIATYYASLYSQWVGGEYPPDSLQYNYGDQYRGEIQLDNSDNPVICSSSRSPDFPTANAFDATLGGQQDAVVCKFDKNLSTLQWSTFLGGSNNDAGYALFIAQNNEVYATGGTRSSDFPATTGSYQPTYKGGKCDGYIARISPGGNTLMAATFIGTASYDQSYFIQLDSKQNVYVYGQSLGSMPVLNATYSNVNGKQFVSKLDSSLNGLIYSTVFGNGVAALNISPSAFLIDCAENIYFSGWGGNIIMGPGTFNMPLTSNAYQSTTDGYNFYLMVLSKNAQSLLYGTYFGGSSSHEHVDGGTSRFDKKGIIYQSVCAGCGGYSSSTIHEDFPIYPPNAWPGTPGTPNHNNQNYNCNNGTFKFKFDTYPHALLTQNITSGCTPLTVNFTNNSVSYTHYLWNLGGGPTDTTSQILNPVKTFTAAGTYTVMLAARNDACFFGYDTVKTVITVYPLPMANFTAVYDSCVNSVSFLNNSTISSGTLSNNWNLGNAQTTTLTVPPTTVYAPGTYTASLVVTSNFGCKDSVKHPLNFILVPYSSYPDTVVCSGANIQLNANGGLSYSWQPSVSLNSSTISNPIATPTTTTIYTVTIHQLDGAGRSCDYKLTDSIGVTPKVTANFTYVKNSCGNTLQFTDSSYVVVNSWDWSFGDGAIDSVQNPVHSYSAVGNYTITLIADNQYGCKDSIKKAITLAGFNPISVSSGTTICNGNSIQLNATGGIAYQWSPSNNLNNANISNPVATPTSTTHYTVNITQVNGIDTCIASLHTNISIAAYSGTTLSAFANPDTIYLGQSSQLGTLTSGGNIVWYPNYNISNVNSQNPTAFPHHTTTYSAMYTDGHGCSFPISSVTIYVLVDLCNEKTVFVPNTFTPNSDGMNDVLYARSNMIEEIHFVIADRWGQIVFDTKDITKGWDGNFNGKPCNPDVFGYYITYKCNNGKESFKKGNITLIR